MKAVKRVIILVIVAAVLGAAAYGAKTVYDAIQARNNAVQEEDTTRWADSTTDALMLEGISDASVKYAEAFVSTRLNVVFNELYMSRQTSYFTVPNGALTITACGTVEGSIKRFKIALWKKVDGGAEYVDGSTGYIHADGQNYRYVVEGLDPNARYRLTISYDSSKYYLYGMAQVEGVSE